MNLDISHPIQQFFLPQGSMHMWLKIVTCFGDIFIAKHFRCHLSYCLSLYRNSMAMIVIMGINLLKYNIVHT